MTEIVLYTALGLVTDPVYIRLLRTNLPQFMARSGNWWLGEETALILIFSGVRSQAEDTMCNLTWSPLTEFVRLQFRIRELT